ncbi:MAG: DUF6800 family protein [Candidatus Binatia bacterium]
MAVPRKRELRRKRTRRAKLAFLRRRYHEAKGANERAKILEKAARVAPGVKLV